MRKRLNQTVLFDGKSLKHVDVWSGDEGWTIHSGEGSETPIGEYAGLVPVLFRSIHQRARAVSSMPFALVDTEGEEVDTSQDWQNVVDFLPNPSNFLYLIEASLCIAGRAYFLRTKNIAGYGKQPRYLLPGSVTLDEKKLAAGRLDFVRRVDMTDKHFTEDDIIYLWALDPSVEIGPARHFPAGVASHACGVLYNVDEFAQAFFERGAIKSMLLTVQGNPPQAERAKLEEWWKRVVGGIRNAWGAKVVNADNIKPVVVGEGMKELENVTLTQEKKEDVAMAFDIPYSILFSNSANYATAERDKLNWYEDSIVPECKFIAAVLTEQLFEPLGYRLQFRPETLDIFQEDEADRGAALAQIVPVLSDPVCEVALDILGYELDDDQWNLLRQIWDRKAEMAEAAADRLANPPEPAPPPEQQAGQPMMPDEQPEEPQSGQMDAAQMKDLDNWRQVALRLHRKGKGNAVDFECRALPETLAAPIRERLRMVTNEADIIDAFYQAPRNDDGLKSLAQAIHRACDLLETA